MVSYPIYGKGVSTEETIFVGGIDLDTGVIILNQGFYDVAPYMTSDGQKYTAMNFQLPVDGDIPTIDNQFQSTNNELAGYARRSNQGKVMKISLLTEDFDPQLTYFVSLRALEKVRLGERAVTTVMSSPLKLHKFMAAINKQNL
jgi:hypothetical protein